MDYDVARGPARPPPSTPRAGRSRRRILRRPPRHGSVRARKPDAVVPLRVKRAHAWPVSWSDSPHCKAISRSTRRASTSVELRPRRRRPAQAEHPAQVAQGGAALVRLQRGPAARGGRSRAGPALDAALATSLEVAAALEARCVVLQTPASVRPTAANKKRLDAVFERIPREGTVRCWEPAGIWERDEVLAHRARPRRPPRLRRRPRGARRRAPPLHAPPRARQVGGARRGHARARRRAAAAPARGVRRRRGRRGEAPRVKQALASELAKMPARSSGVTVVRPGTSTLVAEDEEQ